MCRFSVWCLFFIAAFNDNIFVNSHKCDSFKNVLVELKDITNYEYNKTVNGCMERIEFDDRTITEAYIRNQKIPILWLDSIRNMVQLTTVSFMNCDLSEIKPGAFRNVPRLKKVQMSYCKLTDIPTGVFNSTPNLETLEIHHNDIDFIDDQAFGHLTGLKNVYGSNNRLEFWSAEWFDGSTALEIMDFQRNQIKTIPKRAFTSLQKLRIINFNFNEISTIQPEAFRGLHKLEYLGLRNNRLREIREDIFPNYIKIKSITISANYLNFLSNELLKKLSLTTIIMDYNPWKCPCLDRLHYWIYSTNGTLRRENNCKSNNAPVCAYSKTYSQSCLEYVDSEITKSFIETLKNLSEPLTKNCARLD